MNILNVVIISIALALDASGIAFSIGIDKRLKKYDKLFFIFSFGFFQFLLAFLGGYFGVLFNIYVFKLSSMMGGLIIVIVGMIMIKENLSNDTKLVNFTFLIKMILSICVSIDAFIVGFSTFNSLDSSFILLNYSIIIGIVTCFLSALAFSISRYLSKVKFLKKYSAFTSGIILILFGIKMILF
ncbi:MAG: manganese efflux pump [Senegalia sp. (in: firmicutes)]|uniref:manganese efflux pump n=2 Tax=Senegalia sp. (in: firmicutes) TaxID=1924098 RepID=UPI003F949681